MLTEGSTLIEIFGYYTPFVPFIPFLFLLGESVSGFRLFSLLSKSFHSKINLPLIFFSERSPK